MSPVATSPRFQIVTEFSAFEGWRNCLAVDSGVTPPRPVVLSFVPAKVADSAERLARLSGDVERAGRLNHPAILRVLGMEAFAGAPVVLQEWRDGESLRELLDTGTRMPPEVAARIVAEACDAVAHAHGRATEEGRPFTHGALRAERVLVAVDGSVVVSGFGRQTEGDGPIPTPAQDVRALGALLLECLGGEEPSAAGLPGVPDRLAGVAARAAGPGAPFDGPGALRAAIAEAVQLGGREAVKAWADRVLPPEAGTRGRRRRSLEAALAAPAEAARATLPVRPPAARAAPAAAEEVAEDAIVAALTPVPRAVPPAVPTQVSDDLIVGEATGPMAERRPGEKTPEIAFPRPPPPPAVAWNAVGAAAAVALLAGLAVGYLLGR
jgi:hypothetical protein